MITEEKIRKAIKKGANIDSKFEVELSEITKKVVDLVNKSHAPNLVMEEISEAILRNTSYVIGKNNKYCLDVFTILSRAC